jgi:hypothetical protein
VALIAVAVAVAAWLRPVPDNGPPASSAPTFTDQQIADAKADVCAAYKVVTHAVRVNTHRPNPAPGDEVGILAAAANGRLALYAGGNYLLDRLIADPATPDALVTGVRSLANTLQKFGIDALADEPDTIQDQLRRNLDIDVEVIDQLCQ